MDIFSRILFYPESSTSISRLLCRIIERLISERIFELLWKFIFCGFYLLEKKKIWMIDREEIGKFSFIISGSDTIHIPRYNTHRENKYMTRIEKNEKNAIMITAEFRAHDEIVR